MSGSHAEQPSPRTEGLPIGPQGAVRGRLRVPGSKSLTNRALVLAALADGPSRLRNVLVAEDSEVMITALQDLGVTIEREANALSVSGLGGPPRVTRASLDLRLSGTSIRFLAALVASGRGDFILDGNQRMRQRPIQDLLDALNALGAEAESVNADGCPPVRIQAHGLAGGRASVAGDKSSQFLSALLMAAPYARSSVRLEVTGELLSKPFVDMTLDLMTAFGARVEREGYRSFTIPPGRYQGRDYVVEGDAMAAGYFWAAAAVTGGKVRIDNLGAETRQGDARLAAVLGEMGCVVEWGAGWCEVAGPPPGSLAGGSFDLNDMPDQAQTLAVVGLFANQAVRIENVANMRIKETDRLAAMTAELRRLGATVEERDDGLTVQPLVGAPPAPVDLETYGDHRMAMALAVAGARVPNVRIQDPACVEKTYPAFFEDFLGLLAGGLS